MNFQNDIKIDHDALDVEFVKQASLYLKYSEELALAKDQRDRLKERVDVVKAEMDGMVRRNPAVYDIEKITETTVYSAVIQSKEYEEANKKYLDARLNAELIQAAVSALEQKKYALESLVKLLSMNYFAGPTEARDLSSEVKNRIEARKEDRREETVNSVKERLNSRRRQ